ncbi:MAG: 4-hydroxythreonine-4-phosphate dehydrogenase PdxA, partial [Gracilimonas sp.]
MNSTQIPHIAISVGDFNGIGPEIILKTLSDADLGKSTPVILSPVEVMEFVFSYLPSGNKLNVVENASQVKDGVINLLPIPAEKLKITPGVLSIQSGKVAMQSIEKGIEFGMNGITDALVTAPISKEAVNMAGYKIPGHTEFLAAQTNTKSVLMMLVSGGLRVALVTTHLP